MNDHLNPIFRDVLNSFAALSIRPQAPLPVAKPVVRRPSYLAEVESRVAGIPCLIGVLEYRSYVPDSRADNPYDYYGGAEMEYDILDVRGRRAQWLESKLDDEMRADIERQIVRSMQ